MRRKQGFVLLLLILLARVEGQSQWQPVAGTGGTDIRSTYCAGGILYAGSTNGGFFLSSDGGATWVQRNSGLPPLTVNGIVSLGPTLLAGTYHGGIFSSTNDGVTWVASNSGLLNLRIGTLTVQNAIFFAAVYDSANDGTGGVFKSTNNGATWSASNNGLTERRIYNVFSSLTTLYASGTGGKVFRSTDAGANWTLMNSGIFQEDVRPIAVRGALLLAGLINHGVYRSTNNGTSWDSSNTGLISRRVWDIALVSSTIFAATAGGVFRSTDAGVTWTDVSQGLTNTNHRAMTIAGSYVYVGTSGLGVWRRRLDELTPAPPQIQSFSPAYGQVGTLVTVSGANFSNSPESTIVFFGGVRAQVELASTGSIKTRVPSGATHAAISVTTNGLTGYSRTPFVVTFPTTGSIDASSFAADTALPTGSGSSPYAVTLSDFNGDGKPDLMLSDNTNISGFQVYENTGTGNDIAFGTKVTLGLGTTTRSAAVGDLDSDGRPDIVVTNINNNTVTVYRNLNSGGAITGSSFANGIALPCGTNPREIAIHDYNQDGKPDIAVTNLSVGRVTILRNTHAGGGFTTVSFDTVGFTAGNRPFGIAAGYIDTDGLPDLVVGTDVASTVRVYKNSSANGNISFSASTTILNTAGAPHSVSVADINGDGMQDVVVPGYDKDTVSVFRNMSGPTVQFDQPVFLRVETKPRFAAIGDLDGDGKPDLAIANSGGNTSDQDTVSVLHNESSSDSISFSPRVNFVVGLNPRTLAIGDINGDARPEILSADFAGSSVTILRNEMRQPPRIFSLPASGGVNSTITITGAGFDPVPASNIVYFGAVKAVVTDGTTSTLNVVVPAGASHVPVTVTSFGLTGFSNNAFVVTFPSSGLVDATSLAPRVNFPTGNTPFGITRGDLDGDGKPDLAVANDSGFSVSFLRNLITDGTISPSSFSPRLDSLVGGAPNELIETDFDGDGKLDVAVVSANTNSVSLFRNTSTSGFLSFSQRENIAVGSQPRNIVSADLDSDGKPDLVVADFQNTSISLVRNISTPGSIHFASRTTFPAPLHSRGVSCGDLNNDGMPDIIVASEDQDSIAVYQNISTFGALSLRPRVRFASGDRPLAVQVADIDLDGAPDIIIVNFDEDSLSVLRNLHVVGDINPSSFASRVSFLTGDQPRNLATGDVDGDGKPDVIIPNRGSNTISLFKNASTPGVITSSSLLPKVDFVTGTEPRDVAVGDLNADGKPEVIVSNALDDSLSVFENMVSTSTTAQFTVSRSSIVLGVIQVGQPQSDTVMVSNDGGAPLNITSGSSTDSNFTVTPPAISIPAGGSAVFTITFRPTRTGVDSGQVVFLHNSPSSPDAIGVSGEGTDAVFSSGGPLVFGEVPVDSSRVDSISVTNTGQIDLQINSVLVTDSVFAVNMDPAPISPNQTRKFPVTFTPREPGSRSTPVVFTHNGSGSPTEVVVSGTGITAVFYAEQSSMSFGNVALGDSLIDSLRVTNNGGFQLTINSTSIPPPFRVNTAAFTLLPGMSRMLAITFRPDSAGAVEASMIFNHSGAGSPDTVLLDGVGVEAGFFALADTVSFGTLVVSDSLVRNIVIRNSGLSSLSISSVTSTNETMFAVSSAGTTIAAGDTALFPVTFRPDTADTITAGIIFVHSSTSSPTTIVVTGIGVSRGFFPTVQSLPFGNVTVDSNVTTYLTIRNTSLAALSIDSVVSDNPRFSIEPRDTIIAANQQSDFRVTFTPSDTTHQAGQLIFSYNPGDLQASVPVSGEGRYPGFSPLPSSISYGGVTVRTDSQKTLQVTNNGLVSLTIDSVLTSVPGEFSVSPTFLRIDPGSQGTFTVSFVPVQGGTRAAQLVFVHNGRYDGNPAPSSLPMSGTGLLPTFTTDTTITFSDTGVGQTGNQIINIYNDGPGTLLIDTIIVPPPYGVTGSTRLILEPRLGADILVTFTPTSPTSYPRSMKFFTNLGERLIYLEGTGVSAPGAPAQLSPADGSTGVGIPVPFQWQISDGANSYHLQVALDQSFATLVTNDSSFGNVTTRAVDGLALNTRYYWRVRASGIYGNSPYSSTRVFSSSQSVAYSQRIVYKFPTEGFKPENYRLISFPGTEDYRVGNIFTDAINIDWKVFRDNGDTTGGSIYSQLAADNNMVSGEGYWVLRKGQLNFSDGTPMPALDVRGNDSIPLRNGAGWNIIATRFDRPVNWDDVKAENQSRGLNPNAILYDFTVIGSGDGYEHADTLEPFKGYYLYDQTVTSLIIPYPFPGRTFTRPVQAPIDWKLQLAFYSDKTLDAENYIGISPVSQLERDGLDSPKPPAFLEQSQLYFSKPAWGRRSDRFASDFRPALGEGQVWEFTVNNRQMLPAHITVRGISTLPENIQVVLLDLYNTTPVDLRVNSVYAYQTVSSHMRFKLLVGSPAFVEREHASLIPKEFSLEQNFPNPFNPSTSLKFDLPRDASIRLEVFSSIGQHVVTLADGEYAAGTHTLTWDARNNNGAQVASGLYLYRLMVDGKPLKIRKMMLLR